MSEMENMAEEELSIKATEELMTFLNWKPWGMEKFLCMVVDVPEVECEDFDKRWEAVNKSGKSYIGKVELVPNPNGPDENGIVHNRRLHLHIYSDDYIEWAKNEIEKSKQCLNAK